MPSPRRSPRPHDRSPSSFPMSSHRSGNSSTTSQLPSGSGSNPDEPLDFSLLGDTPSWLRSLRLHKYTPNFEGIGWKEMVKMSDEDLEKRGVSALGARRKLTKCVLTVPQLLLFSCVDKHPFRTGSLKLFDQKPGCLLLQHQLWIPRLHPIRLLLQTTTTTNRLTRRTRRRTITTTKRTNTRMRTTRLLSTFTFRLIAKAVLPKRPLANYTQMNFLSRIYFSFLPIFRLSPLHLVQSPYLSSPLLPSSNTCPFRSSNHTDSLPEFLFSLI